ncbi:hypothetical protein SAMN06265365_107111 [Tistlia consotensis]|uniref:Uncharacterized protein n=1 Tax=Tistlia consotensis USBA 355 TaxID=560819 RepID=A0A1Y6BD53_9PROT|nr:hypothetical protein [Tistlia consotensis]SME97837.1 hypothetical protein SAMN05428998_102113 [Tistlia consotensis USBA 355]SNR57201.1 hypothetical protein SAMN06265365_107111 [Tistlia consotensis]
MSALSFKGQLHPPAWWPEVKRVAARVILGPDQSPPKAPLPDTVEQAREGKISDWLRMD